MSDDGRWLRDTLDPDPGPPADLADRVDRTARRIVRRRIAASAAAAALVVTAVVVPLAVAGGSATNLTAGPNATANPGGAICPPRSSPSFHRMRSDADFAWPYRGDAALRATAVAVGKGLTDVRPLFAARFRGGSLEADGSTVEREHTVVAVAGKYKNGTLSELRWGTERGELTGQSPAPALGSSAVLSLLVQTGPPVDGIAGTLVVLAPPGTTQITYTSCPVDGTKRYTVHGDVAVLPLPPRDLEGTVEVRAPAGVQSFGSPQTGSSVPDAYPVHPLPVPTGYREVPGAIVGGESVTYRGSATLDDARVLVRCRAVGDTDLTVVGGPAPVRCDGQVRVGADGLALRPGTRLIDLPRLPLRVDVLVAVPDR